MIFESDIEAEYFEWLYGYVCEGRAHNYTSYRKLFEVLYSIEFTYLIRNDANRAEDGMDLRYRFAMSRDDESIAYILDKPCSVLEMIIALAVRCEETIMGNTNYGDRMKQWFWGMLHNLGIAFMHDEVFDEAFVEDAVYNFLERRYDPDGRGGLFFIKNCEDDLRDVEIWVQLCWYLDKFA